MKEYSNITFGGLVLDCSSIRDFFKKNGYELIEYRGGLPYKIAFSMLCNSQYPKDYDSKPPLEEPNLKNPEHKTRLFAWYSYRKLS